MHFKYLFLAPYLLSLSACMTATIDESSVFMPTKYTFDPDRKGMAIDKENILSGKGVGLSHFKIVSDIGPIAMTLATRPAYAGRPLILTCMGNASDRRKSGASYIDSSIDFGDVLIFDYPGYNDSAGEASEKDFNAAVKAIITHVENEKSKTGRPIVAWGQSLGGFICSEMVKRSDAFDGNIIETSAQNAKQVAKTWVPAIAKPFVDVDIKESLLAYDSANAMKEFKGPILVLGAGKDKVLEVELSRKLSASLAAQGNDIEYVEFSLAGHNNLRSAKGFENTAKKFFAKFR